MRNRSARERTRTWNLSIQARRPLRQSALRLNKQRTKGARKRGDSFRHPPAVLRSGRSARPLKTGVFREVA